MVIDNKMILEQFKLRPANALDAAQFVEIMNSQYARKKNQEYFYWQYINPPEPTVLMCAFQGDQMCGMFGLKKRKLNNGVVIGQAIDMLIAPAWRKKGLFPELARQAVQYFGKEFDVLSVLANAAGNHAVVRSLGWRNAGIIKTFFLKNPQSVTCRPDGTDAGDCAGKVRFQKDQDYRNWRFDKNPCYSYKAVSVENATAWVKVFIDPLTNLRYGDIVDFDIPCLEAMNFRNLFYAACEYLKLQKVEAITVWALPGGLLRNIAESFGFQETSQERYFCLKIISPKCAYLDKFINWDLSEADSEIY
ncbi:MAG: GNAT family N-acetyltransferase [Candidatus Omnitrophica bacterium]|nr:GNAT family N-acetyltransferase [Candidatus Omnitrophota bacterium]